MSLFFSYNLIIQKRCQRKYAYGSEVIILDTATDKLNFTVLEYSMPFNEWEKFWG